MDKKIIFILLILISIGQSSFAQNDSSYVRTEKEEPVEQAKKKVKERQGIPFKEKVFIGLYPGFAISNVGYNIEASPVAGVEVLPRLSLGAGMVYKRSKGERVVFSQGIGYYDKYNSTGIGYRAFAFFNVYNNFCAYAESEGVSVDVESDLYPQKFWEPGFKAGLLYKSEFNSKFSANFLALYNFLYKDDQTSTGSPLDIRIGIVFYPFRSNSY